MEAFPPRQGLYDPRHERDSCGIALVADLEGRRTHAIVAQALAALARLRHRGATGRDAKSGDGAGIMLQIPHGFFAAELARDGVVLPSPGDYGVGQLFLPRDDGERRRAQARIEAHVRDVGLVCLGWRAVPTRVEALGPVAAAAEPDVRQLFVATPAAPCAAYEIDAQLFRLRHRIEREGAYVVSLSARTLVYKGMLLPEALADYYPDLVDGRLDSALALVHSRFSTNTFPSWQLAQPFRYLCHNGEINTLRGNVAWMRAREAEVAADLAGEHAAEVLPLTHGRQSDSACLDNALEALTLGCRDVGEALLRLVPPAWEKDDRVPADVRALHEAHATTMEPWDGPAALCICDGRVAGVALDRSGLRPCRYVVTRGGLVVMASEAGAVPVPPEELVRAGRIGPGQMLLVDTATGRLETERDVAARVAAKRPCESWVTRSLLSLPAREDEVEAPEPFAALAFGYTREELRLVLAPMANSGQEAISSMGDDVPPAVLLPEGRLLFDYFRQQFAQVTNPPIDPIREDLVMSLAVRLGPKGNPVRPPEPGVRLVRLKTPVMTSAELASLRLLAEPGVRVHELSLLFPAAGGTAAFTAALANLTTEAASAAANSATVLLLSDRGVDRETAALPSLLATAAVHHHLLRAGLRSRVSLVVETGEARSVHHVACLIGYGAAAVCPYLALAEARRLAGAGHRYVEALGAGLKKVLSKMGITTVASYCGAQVFEALGLGEELIREFFPGTASPLGGLTLAQVAGEALERHRAARALADVGETALPAGGDVHYRTQEARHAWSPESIALLQHAVRGGGQEAFVRYTAEVDASPDAPLALRHLLAFDPTRTPVPLTEVEPAQSLVRRFTTGAMSLGAISREAHETLAVAMNVLGGKSNSGEGGEDPARFVAREDEGVTRSSAIKQVASARFGVTIHYLVHARELQIKIAQGAKPGEGGQLPGAKVDSGIARLRHATPGVQLISPPPHHDIYSIEDLAQLILDLRHANPVAAVSVKLVASTGIGAIAVGVAKAGADKIVVSGGDGGTGASPLSSIKHAGLPWEVGLAEVQQALLLNGLRDRVRLETDGQLKSGRDVVVAALLGADECGFATAPLIAQGCIMMRKCHLNTCPVGIATQDPELRARFTGTPEHVINFLFLVAEQARHLMAQLGVRWFRDLVGRTDLLRPVRPGPRLAKAAGLDLAPLLARPAPASGSGSVAGARRSFDPGAFAQDLLADCGPALAGTDPVRLGRVVTPADRAVGTLLSGRIAEAHGERGLPQDRIRIVCRGDAGQSFGAFLAPGVTLELVGLANDYVGKGLSGGLVVLRSPSGRRLDDESPVLAGNTLLYGATSGYLYAAGAVGERFAVRNSGAHAIVEGTGDHACEYMTGGLVLILGPTGRNFGAGMSGGLAFVLDEDGFFERRVNHAMVELERVGRDPSTADAALLRRLVARHRDLTGSLRAERLLRLWPSLLERFVKVVPKELKALAASRGTSVEALARLRQVQLVSPLTAGEGDGRRA